MSLRRLEMDIKPVVLKLNKDGKYETIDGFHRLNALQILEYDTVDAWVGQPVSTFEAETFEARFVRSLNTPRQPMPWDLEPNMAEEGMPYLTRREYDSMSKIGYTDEEIRNGYQRSFGSESFEAESLLGNLRRFKLKSSEPRN